MDCGSRHNPAGVPGLLQIEDCLDADGGVVMPPGATLTSLVIDGQTKPLHQTDRKVTVPPLGVS